MNRRKSLAKNSFSAESADGTRHTVDFEPGQSVLRALEAAEIDISTSCGGMGTCGTCRIEILHAPAELEKINEIEAEMAEARGFSANERLACQITAIVNLQIKIPS